MNIVYEGTDGFRGFRTGRAYKLEKSFNKGKKGIIVWICGVSAFYSSLEEFMQNWRFCPYCVDCLEGRNADRE